MISKITLKENKNGIDFFLLLDLLNSKLLYLKNNEVIKQNKIDSEIEEINELVKQYVIHWDNNYIDNCTIDGINIELIINVDNETLKYNFKNKTPYSYNKFITKIKSVVNIYE